MNNFQIIMNNLMVESALQNAKAHGINVHHINPTPPNGDCAFIAIADNISTRQCFR